MCNQRQAREKEHDQFVTGFDFIITPLHSTRTALLDAVDNWYLNFNNGSTNTILFIDLKKAFDTTDHEIPLRNLKLYGFNGRALQFRNYLSEGMQVLLLLPIYPTSFFAEDSCGGLLKEDK